MADGNGKDKTNGAEKRRRASCEGAPEATVNGGAPDEKAPQAAPPRAETAAETAATTTTIATDFDGVDTAGRQEETTGGEASPSPGDRGRESQGWGASSSPGAEKRQEGFALGGTACAGSGSRAPESQGRRGLAAARARAAGTLSSIACRFARPGTEAELPLPLTAGEDGDPVRLRCRGLC